MLLNDYQQLLLFIIQNNEGGILCSKVRQFALKDRQGNVTAFNKRMTINQSKGFVANVQQKEDNKLCGNYSDMD